MPGFLFDLHCHTKEGSFDADLPAAELVRGLVSRGFSGAVLTDHNHVWSQGDLMDLVGQLGLADTFILLSGQEVRTAHEGIVQGDLLVYGLPVAIADGISPVELLRLVRSHEGFVVAPHPAVPRIGFGPALDSFPVTAIEVWNGRYGVRAASQARRLAERLGLPSVGGSDTHTKRGIGLGGTLFERRPLSLGDIRDSIRVGEARPWRPRSHPFRIPPLFTRR